MLNAEISLLTQKIVDQQILIHQQTDENVSCTFNNIAGTNLTVFFFSIIIEYI